MSAMFFGQYLLERGAIDRDALLDGLARQRRRNRSLPQLAVREGLLSESEARAVELAYRTVLAPMDELLMSVGGLTPDAVERLEVMQRADWMRIGAALIEGGHLDAEQVERFLREFASQTVEVEESLQERFASLPSPRVVEACVELALHHVSRLTDVPAKVARFETPPELASADDVRRSSQRITGDAAFVVVIDLPPTVGNLAASRLVGSTLAAGGDDEADALREVVNLVGGHACTELEAAGLRLRPEPPRSDVEPEALARARSIVHAECATGDGRFDVWVVLE